VAGSCTSTVPRWPSVRPRLARALRSGHAHRAVVPRRLTRRGRPASRPPDGARPPSAQPPFDAFWGARYAIVEDPDGNHIGLMSPSDPALRTAPPKV
jgi:hypothetical protein